ncbi:MAG: hypothetical protein JW782_00215 [Candidatus Saganbacteria bacterium]|nr:hypothetical protein [Candidatus Saganbacteria bacterium]
MKNIVIFSLALALLLPCAALAADSHSQEYYFVAAVLQSVYQYEQGRMVMAGDGEEQDLAEQVEAIRSGIAQWREGRRVIKPHLEDDVLRRRALAAAVDDGLAVYISNAERTAALLERSGGGWLSDEDALIDEGLDMEADEDNAMLMMSKKLSAYVPARLSKQERAQLLLRIDLLFAKQLKNYRLRPDLVDELIPAVADLESRLKDKPTGTK